MTQYLNTVNNPQAIRVLKAFCDWFSDLGTPEYSLVRPHPDRHLLLDDVPIVLSHGNLHRDNVIVSLLDPAKVLAVVDWGSTGWPPENWDYCKARWVAGFEGEWATIFIPQIFGKKYENYYNSWFFWGHRLG